MNTIEITNKSVLESFSNNTQPAEIDFDSPEPYPGRKPRLQFNWGGNEHNIDDWNDWTWQIKNSIKSSKDLIKVFQNQNISIPKEIMKAEKVFPMAITPYYFSLIKKFDYSDPIFKQSVPDIRELCNPSFLKDDPLNEEEDTVINGLVHRYNDRALIISTSQCSMYCRFCTRKRVAGSTTYHLTDCQLDNIITYLKSHPEIKDVIISGGDPFTMSTNKLENIISKVRSVESVDIIRIGTRTPVVMPQRITDELVNMISQYHPIFVNTHFNHPNEITEDSKNACLKMINKGIPVNNQSVLLNGINDNFETMSTLCRNLLKIRVKPYYLFQCDLVKGIEHFRTSIQDGIDLMDSLRGRVSGLGIPHYIIDSPEGKGKIPVLPNYILEQNKEGVTLRNYKNEKVFYPNPK